MILKIMRCDCIYKVITDCDDGQNTGSAQPCRTGKHLPVGALESDESKKWKDGGNRPFAEGPYKGACVPQDEDMPLRIQDLHHCLVIRSRDQVISRSDRQLKKYNYQQRYSGACQKRNKRMDRVSS